MRRAMAACAGQPGARLALVAAELEAARPDASAAVSVGPTEIAGSGAARAVPAPRAAVEAAVSRRVDVPVLALTRVTEIVGCQTDQRAVSADPIAPLGGRGAVPAVAASLAAAEPAAVSADLTRVAVEGETAGLGDRVAKTDRWEAAAAASRAAAHSSVVEAPERRVGRPIVVRGRDRRG